MNKWDEHKLIENQMINFIVSNYDTPLYIQKTLNSTYIIEEGNGYHTFLGEERPYKVTYQFRTCKPHVLDNVMAKTPAGAVSIYCLLVRGLR